MSKLVYLKLDGDLQNKGFRVTLEIREDGGPSAGDITKNLPANPALAALIEKHWDQEYRSLGNPFRHKQKKVFNSLYSLKELGNKFFSFKEIILASQGQRNRH